MLAYEESLEREKTPEQKIDELSRGFSNTPEDVDLLRKALLSLYGKYGEYILDEDKIILSFFRLRALFGSLSEVRGKRILDLACGSTLSDEAHNLVTKLVEVKRNGGQIEDTPQYRGLKDILELTYTSVDFNTGEIDRRYEPWTSRILSTLGADVVGVDIGNLEGETFEHYSIDLSKKGALDIFPAQSFDAVNGRLLPDISKSKSEQSSFKKEIEEQVKRVLKEKGRVVELN